jgi:hypothetical protein
MRRERWVIIVSATMVDEFQKKAKQKYSILTFPSE